VLTPPERAAERPAAGHVPHETRQLPRLRWGDCPRIRAVLESIRGKS
jgi:hypothetical protein